MWLKSFATPDEVQFPYPTVGQALCELARVTIECSTIASDVDSVFPSTLLPPCIYHGLLSRAFACSVMPSLGCA